MGGHRPLARGDPVPDLFVPANEKRGVYVPMPQGLKNILWNKKAGEEKKNGKIRGRDSALEQLAQRRGRPSAESTSFLAELNA
jgi:hypothetical protein